MQASSLQGLIIITASLLTLSTACGLMFGIFIQPQRKRSHWFFALYLAIIGLWAFMSLVLRIPSMTLLQNRLHDVYLYATFWGLTPVAFFYATIAFSQHQSRLARFAAIWAVPVTAGSLFLLWTNQALLIEPGASASSLALEEIASSYEVLPGGLLIILIAVVLLIVLNIVLRAEQSQPGQSLALPALLLAVGYGSNLVPGLRSLSADTVLASVVALMSSAIVFRRELLNPMNELNEKLGAVNQELRNMVSELTLEKDKTDTLNAELQTVSQYKSSFLARVSHELRTPLNSIVGYSELLVQGLYGQLNDQQVKRISRIHASSQELLGLINNILDLNSLDRGKISLVRHPMQLSAITDTVVSGLAPAARHKGIRLDIDLADDLPTLYIDPQRMHQVLDNLLYNAIAFTTQGSVALRARNLTLKDAQEFPPCGKLKGGNWVIIEVQDTGTGIAPEDQGRIFEAFHVSPSSETNDSVGPGLGLTLSRQLIELHGGHIGLESTPGAGSTFTVALPAMNGTETTYA